MIDPNEERAIKAEEILTKIMECFTDDDDPFSVCVALMVIMKNVVEERLNKEKREHIIAAVIMTLYR